MRILFIPFVAVLLFGIFSSSAYALTATMKGNNESAFGDSFQSSHDGA